MSPPTLSSPLPVPCMGQTTSPSLSRAERSREIQLRLQQRRDGHRRRAHFFVENKTHKYRDQLRLDPRSSSFFKTSTSTAERRRAKHRGVIVRLAKIRQPLRGSVINIVKIRSRLAHSEPATHFGCACRARLWTSATRRLRFRQVLGLLDSGLHRPITPSFEAVVAAALETTAADSARACDTDRSPAKPSEKITEVPRRGNHLNVSPDGKVCLFDRTMRQAQLYSLRLRAGDYGCNVLDVTLSKMPARFGLGYRGWGNSPVSSTTTWLNNATKKRGRVVHPGALPFTHRKTAR